MRKVSVLMLALMLAGGLAFASDVTISGQVDHAWQFGSGEVAGTTDPVYDNGLAELDLKVTAVVDDINTAVVKLEEKTILQDAGLAVDDDGEYIGGTFGVEIDELYFDTNLGAAFGLGDMASVMTRVGYYENDAFLGNITAAEFENVADIGSELNQIQMTVGVMDMVTLKGIIVPGEGAAMDGFIGVTGGYGPVSAELFFTDVAGRKPADGSVGFGVQYSDTMVPDTLDLAASAELHALLSDENKVFQNAESQIQYGAGVSATALNIATLGVSVRGESEHALEALGVDLNVEPVAFAGLDLLATFGIDDDVYEETFQYFEGSVYLKPGAATFRVGYSYFDGEKVAKPLGATENAGALIEGAESGFAFFRATLDY